MCGGEFTSSTGLLYPIDLDNDGFYDNDQDCLWSLLAATDNVIELQFQEFDMEYHYVCAFDFIRVYLFRFFFLSFISSWTIYVFTSI